MLTHMKTTIEISDSLFRLAKREALKKNTTLRSLFQEALMRFLKGTSSTKKNRSKIKLHTFKGDGYVDPSLEGNWPAIRELIYEPRIK